MARDSLVEVVMTWLDNVDGGYVRDDSPSEDRSEVLIDISGGSYADLNDLAQTIRKHIAGERTPE